ncbi:MAG: endolytic transglycosylase MltG [candidate division WOR-3 bacterium]
MRFNKNHILFIFALLIFYIYGFLYHSFPPNAKRGSFPFRIKKGEGVILISKNLKNYGIIKNENLWAFLAILIREENKILEGLYFLDKNMNEVLCLKSIRYKFSLVPYVRITIPEGYNLKQISRIISENFNISYDSVYLFFTSPDKIRPIFEKFNLVPVKTLEGYIFPDTYEFPSGASPYEIGIRGVENLIKVLKEIGYDTLDSKMDLHKLLTLASIVEKEAVFDFERPLIASVFLNRLRIGLPLQADPTIKYVIEEEKGRLSLKDLLIDSPYNTYKHKGLPPGPICSPGRSSIKASLYPASTDYLYFVSKGDGTHHFSKSFEEHKGKKAIYKKVWNF